MPNCCGHALSLVLPHWSDSGHTCGAIVARTQNEPSVNLVDVQKGTCMCQRESSQSVLKTQLMTVWPIGECDIPKQIAIDRDSTRPTSGAESPSLSKATWVERHHGRHW